MAIPKKKVETTKSSWKAPATSMNVKKQSCKSNFSTEALNRMIQERAYYIWEEKGKPQGQDSDIWGQAEKEICAKYGK